MENNENYIGFIQIHKKDYKLHDGRIGDTSKTKPGQTLIYDEVTDSFLPGDYDTDSVKSISADDKSIYVENLDQTNPKIKINISNMQNNLLKLEQGGMYVSGSKVIKHKLNI